MPSPVRGMLAQVCGCEYLDDFSTCTHTHLHCVHICMHTVMGYTHSNDFSHLSLVCKYRNVQTSAVVDISVLQKEKLVFEAFQVFLKIRWETSSPQQQPGTQSVRKHATQWIFSCEYTRTSQNAGSQHQCPDHREFVLSWLGRQDESVCGQLTGRAYSSAREKRVKNGARDSKRNELSPRATCLAICITLQILQWALTVV